MKNIATICLFALLAGCVTVPVTQNFPKVPESLQVAPPDLKEVPANSSASEVFDVVIENYGTYNDIANKLRGWQRWYIEQKKVFESAQ